MFFPLKFKICGLATRRHSMKLERERERERETARVKQAQQVTAAT